jgi:hypothetical protein
MKLFKMMIIMFTLPIIAGCPSQKVYCEDHLMLEDKKQGCGFWSMGASSMNPRDPVVDYMAFYYCLSAIEAQKECDKKSEYLPNFND